MRDLSKVPLRDPIGGLSECLSDRTNQVSKYGHALKNHLCKPLDPGLPYELPSLRRVQSRTPPHWGLGAAWGSAEAQDGDEKRGRRAEVGQKNLGPSLLPNFFRIKELIISFGRNDGPPRGSLHGPPRKGLFWVSL